MQHKNGFPILSADEAAALIPDGAMVAISGFTPSGSPKAIPRALAARAKELHASGKPFSIRLLSGASTGPDVDDALAEAHALSWRAPYQTSKPLRDAANAEQIDFIDIHLSHVPKMVLEGFLGRIDVAIVEATEVTRDGKVYLTTGIGGSPTYLQCADRVLIELNSYHSPRLRELTDIVVLPPPPCHMPIDIESPLDRIGQPFATVDPAKIIGIVETCKMDGGRPLAEPDEVCKTIARHLVQFLLDELRIGRIPASFLPIQSGVGNIANAVMYGLGEHPDIPNFSVYTEVFQGAMLDLMRNGRILGASSTSLTLTDTALDSFYEDMDFFAPRIVLRPQELSNHPGVIRKLGVIAINTAIEVDLYGHANSTHLFGTQLMNGIGGSGDFERNAYLSIFITPSVAKDGRISSIVPFASHVDHSEHSVHVVVTEQGLADLRGLSPLARARLMIDRCAHPAYRDYLRRYLDGARRGHLRHNLRHCFDLHENYLELGQMLPGLDFPLQA